jgi:hypothetical protein
MREKKKEKIVEAWDSDDDGTMTAMPTTIATAADCSSRRRRSIDSGQELGSMAISSERGLSRAHEEVTPREF